MKKTKKKVVVVVVVVVVVMVVVVAVVVVVVVVAAAAAAAAVVIAVVIIMIAMNGAIRDLLQSPHCAANCLHHVSSSGHGAIVCKSRAPHRALITCNMSCKT